MCVVAVTVDQVGGISQVLHGMVNAEDVDALGWLRWFQFIVYMEKMHSQ